jgi:hypothetical protein
MYGDRFSCSPFTIHKHTRTILSNGLEARSNVRSLLFSEGIINKLMTDISLQNPVDRNTISTTHKMEEDLYNKARNDGFHLLPHCLSPFLCW